MRLDHQIADGEHEAILVDHDARALALAPEALHGLPVRIDEGLDAHDRRDKLFERGGARGRAERKHHNQQQTPRYRQSKGSAASVPHDSFP